MVLVTCSASSLRGQNGVTRSALVRNVGCLDSRLSLRAFDSQKEGREDPLKATSPLGSF